MERVWHLVRLSKLLQGFFDGKLCYGGGFVLNYFFLMGRYGEPPRFTFDLDASWMDRAVSKRRLLREFLRFNKYLQDLGECLEVPVGDGRSIELYVVEYDLEKDYFPNILSLRYPVVTRWSGEEFHSYVRRVTGEEVDFNVIRELRRAFSRALGVEEAKIDYVRFEVSVGFEFPVKREKVDLPFGMGRVELDVTELEYQLAAKIVDKVARDFGADLSYNLPDILKAVSDLRLLGHVDVEKVRKYVVEMTDGDFQSLIANAYKNLDALLERGKDLWLRHHYLLIRRTITPEELVERIRENLASMT